MPNDELKKLVSELQAKSIEKGICLFHLITTKSGPVKEIMDLLDNPEDQAKFGLALVATHASGHTEGFLEARGIDPQAAREALIDVRKES